MHVRRPNLSIGAVPRNFYGPSSGVRPAPSGVTNNAAVSPYTTSGGTISKLPPHIWTVSIGGSGDSYTNLPAVPPGVANGGSGYLGGGQQGSDAFYYPNPGVNLVLNGISTHGGEKFGGKTFINGEIMNSNYI